MSAAARGQCRARAAFTAGEGGAGGRGAEDSRCLGAMQSRTASDAVEEGAQGLGKV